MAGPVKKEQSQEIHNVPSFVSAVLMRPVEGVQAFFRGSSKHYPLTIPSVFRSEQWRRSEKDLFNSLLASHPQSFADDNTTLDKLVRMQHHGLPTRLLDITANPLMALYFASEANPEEDGEATRFEFRSVDVKYPDSDRAAVMANLARLTNRQRRELDTSLKLPAFNVLPAVGKLLHFIRQEKPYFEPLIKPRHVRSIMVIRGKQNNPRIIAQSGAFLLFGEQAIFEKSSKGRDIRLQTFVIKAEAKRRIIRELDQLNVNHGTVYPGLESSASYIKLRYEGSKLRGSSKASDTYKP
jgi:FRG domain